MSFNLFVIRLIDSPHRVSKREFWDSTVDGRENRSFVSQSMFFPTLRDEVGLLRKRKEKVVALNFARSIDWILKLIGEKLDFTKDVKDRRESWLNSFRNTLSRISFIDRPTATRYIIPTPIKRIDRRPSITTTTTLPLERISRVHAEINARACTRRGRGMVRECTKPPPCIDFPSRIWGRTTVLRANGESQRIRDGRESVESETKLA